MCKFTSHILRFFVALCLTGFIPVSSALAVAPMDNADSISVLSSAYFPIFPLGAGDDVSPALLPVVSNHPLDGDHSGITRAIVIIHDYTRDAKANAAMIASLAGGDNATTFILAPQFLLDADIARLSGLMPEQSKLLAHWSLDGWVDGGESLNEAPQKPISSFTAMDLLLLYLGDKKMFPDLQSVIIAGHGMGGDFVQHYAATGQAPDILDREHISIHFLAANPSSYLYFTAPRFLIGKPGTKPSLGTPDAAQCPGYNVYPYGLDNPNAYVKRAGIGAIKLRYTSRPVTYLVGERAAEGDALADNSCAAALQGPNRVARWTAYNMYLTVTFGDAAQKLHKFTNVPKAGYEPAALFGSPCGVSVLFGSGECR
jgi:hypothetical protein